MAQPSPPLAKLARTLTISDIPVVACDVSPDVVICVVCCGSVTEVGLSEVATSLTEDGVTLAANEES